MHVSFLRPTCLARTDDAVSSFPSNKLIVTPHVCRTENYLWIKLHHHSTRDGRARNIVRKVFCWHGHISLHGWLCSNKGFINKNIKNKMNTWRYKIYINACGGVFSAQLLPSYKTVIILFLIPNNTKKSITIVHYN